MKRAMLLAVLLTGCATSAAQTTMRTQDTGTVTLHGNVDEAWVDARTQMDSHCGAGQWKVMKEEKVQTGTYATNWGYGITTAQPIQGTAVTYVCTR
jgi:hypothetical protein